MCNGDVKIVLFKKLLHRDVAVLRLMGLHSMDGIFTGNMEKPKIWESVVFEIGLINLVTAVSFGIRKSIAVWGEDPEYVIGAMSSIFSGVLCFIKGWRLWTCREDVRHLLRRFAILWNEANLRVRIREENTRIALETCFVNKLNTIMTTVLCLTYAVQPYMLLLNHYASGRFINETYDYTQTVYAASYPWPTGTTTKYLLCVTWEQFVIYFVALYLIASDVMFAQLATHTAIQFRVLWYDLEHITEFENDEDIKNESILIERLSNIVERHCDLYTYCKQIERLFNPIVFLALSFTAVHICFGAFHLHKEMIYGNWDEVAKGLLHATTVAIQASIYCGYSHQLTEQSILMAKAAYECEWTERSKEFKIMLNIIMMRSQKPFICSAYGFFYVGLSQMTTIFKTAGSYFALLQSLA